MRSKFKDEHPFEKRKGLFIFHSLYLDYLLTRCHYIAEAERIRQKYADRIPVCQVIILTLMNVLLIFID